MPRDKKPTRPQAKRGKRPDATTVAGVRIIGGEYRGRKIAYSGDPRTRPMKDRVREALFNLLGKAVRGKVAIDLFAGTGALALEAISRGAERAIAVELHRPTARLISENAAALGIGPRVEIVTGNTFIWAGNPERLPAAPWVVFCSPPYELYATQRDEMMAMLGKLFTAAPTSSLFAVEADERFDFHDLPAPDEWDVRAYPPAILGIWEKHGHSQP